MRQFGDLSDTDRERQAEKFLDMHRREGGEWESAFEFWSSGKDFHPGDAHAIRRIVRDTLTSTGERTVVDIREYLDGAA